ncbi:MAG: ABC transporter permease [Gemmatimonadota bacterium]|nr:MAG: ABC transporter permease [Gemmatimonadota bacterium]
MTRLLRGLWLERQARWGLVLVAALCGLAVLAPWIAPYDPAAQLDLAQGQYLAPSTLHPFGTDFYSRDLLSRVLYGARISLSIAFLSVLVSITVGTAVGMTAGLAGGAVDRLLMRGVDAALAVPRVFLLLVVVALWEGVSVTGLIVVLGLTSWFGTSRIVRAEVLSLRQRTYITAARALGVGPRRLALRHLLPNLAAPVIVAATLGIGQIILIEASLSYLGVGVPPPTPSWGSIIQEGQQALAVAPWVATFPGLAIVATVIGFSLLGDGLRDTLDPTTR